MKQVHTRNSSMSNSYLPRFYIHKYLHLHQFLQHLNCFIYKLKGKLGDKIKYKHGVLTIINITKYSHKFSDGLLTGGMQDMKKVLQLESKSSFFVVISLNVTNFIEPAWTLQLTFSVVEITHKHLLFCMWYLEHFCRQLVLFSSKI